MEVTVNQQSHILSETCSVEELVLNVLKRQSKGLAVAVNQMIVPKSNWENQRLNSGDQIVVITATQGG